jgi:DNA-binding XRE family transcriptional regulator
MSNKAAILALRLELGRQRDTKKLTYDDLAKLSGVSRRTLIAIETGTSPGSIQTWLHICRGLQINFSTIIETSEGNKYE